MKPKFIHLSYYSSYFFLVTVLHILRMLQKAHSFMGVRYSDFFLFKNACVCETEHLSAFVLNIIFLYFRFFSLIFFTF